MRLCHLQPAAGRLTASLFPRVLCAMLPGPWQSLSTPHFCGDVRYPAAERQALHTTDRSGITEADRLERLRRIVTQRQRKRPTKYEHSSFGYVP
jgi:hypothetical protein